MEYKLLTPGPLTTSRRVKEVMMVDHCTWDNDYKAITQDIRQRLLTLAGVDETEYTVVLMQGSGSFGVEAVLGSEIGPQDHLLICSNGAYGQRIVQMSDRLGLNYSVYQVPDQEMPQADVVKAYLDHDPTITSIAMVHSETTSGILNDLTEIAALAKERNLLFIVDAMSSFGGVRIDVAGLDIDFLISSANKCIQGVPGFSFIIGKKAEIEQRKDFARSLSLDIYSQYKEMDKDGKWRFTSPTHTVLAFHQALIELEEEGGIDERYLRYRNNNQLLRSEMTALGYEPVIKDHQGPFITSFYYPEKEFDFDSFYNYLKEHGFVIYPGKISELACFRIGNIGEIYAEDIKKLTKVIANYKEMVVV
ncbi:2-aminoethylphosphonate--pyruvate transaminase [Enterococcus sp. DIV0876]|uniref:2-aminoethylphosphonate--pyruvate transaminase n=1 Tax=Enterococcus sp. DIV0876 TaxID=2774633 RepID=UPI003D2FD5C1